MRDEAQSAVYIRRIEHTDVGIPAHLHEQVYAQARIDPVTLGCNAIKSACTLHPNGLVRRLSMTCWYRLPNNAAAQVSLFELETSLTGNIRELTIAGRPVGLGNAPAVEAALQAIRHIHDDLRESRYPNVALAFHENELGRHIGKTIKIVGQKLSGEADFAFFPLFNSHAAGQTGPDMATPEDPDMFKALLGLGANPLRPDMDLLKNRLRVVPAYEPTAQATYENRLQAQQGRNGNLRMQMATHKRGAEPESEQEIYREFFRIDARGGARLRLQDMRLMGRSMKGRGHAAQARMMGATACMAGAFARHSAPVPLLHLVNYDLRAAMTDPEIVARLQGVENPFLRISLAGNRYTKIYGPYGSDLGNSTLLMHAGVTILHDFAFKPAPEGEKTSGAIPSIQDWLPGIDIICLSHRHIDHAGGIPYEDFRGKTILATPQVIEHVRDSMRTVHGSKARERMPAFIPLTENGFHTISKDGGKSGITILFSPNATPHSSYCTPFYYAAFETTPQGHKIIKAVYANMGDTRDEDNVSDWWFSHGWQKYIKKAHPDLDIADIPMRPTLAEWDSTSVRYSGSTPTKAEVMDNMKMATAWFDGYTILSTHLASSDNQFDIMVQCAADSGRDFTAFGKNMETTQRIQNIFGYEELNEPWPQGHQNQIRMDEVHAKKLAESLKAMEAQRPAPDMLAAFDAEMDENFAAGAKLRGKARAAYKENLDEAELAAFDDYVRWKKAEKKNDDITADIHRLHLLRTWLSDEGFTGEAAYVKQDLTRALHRRLSRYTNNYWRFRRRAEYAAKYGIDDAFDLGALAITRATLTSARMFMENPRRMFVALTGSQGNEVEIEAQLPKFLEKRSLLNLDPRHRHTARPVDPKQAVLMLTQPAIVGNEKAREKLVRKAARDYGMVVVNATHDGFEIYNTNRLEPAVLQKIRADIGAKGVLFREEDVDRRLVVSGPLPLGYRGHGRRQDIMRWMLRLRAEVNAPQHINDPEAAHDMEILSRSLHQGSVPLIEDFEVSILDRFAKTPSEKVRVLGTIPAGVTVLRMEHPNQKPYRPVLHKTRIIALEPDAKASLLQPMMAGCRERTAVLRELGPVTPSDDVDVRKSGTQPHRPSTRPALSDFMRHAKVQAWAARPAVAPVPAPGSARARPRTIELV